MKIAILTLPLHTNYGGILQAYSLQIVLQRMGHTVEHLQPRYVFKSLHPFWKMPFVWCKRLIKKIFFRGKQPPIFKDPYKWVCENTDEFINKYINVRYLRDDEWNSQYLSNYEYVIVGSDQVWRPKYAIPIERYFSDSFNLRDVKSVAYAASFGTMVNEYSEEQRSRCARLLKGFHAVSVREISAVNLCEDLFGVKAEAVLDPTMLLKKEDYLQLLQRAKVRPLDGNLMIYLLDDNLEFDGIVSDIEHSLGLRAFLSNSRIESEEANIVEKYQPRVEQWIKGFDESEFILTDSFHACVFAIIFRKNFIVYGNKNRGLARFEDLLGLFGLQNRLITSIKDYYELKSQLLQPINYIAVDRILDVLRKQSYAFLERSL